MRSGGLFSPNSGTVHENSIKLFENTFLLYSNRTSTAQEQRQAENNKGRKTIQKKKNGANHRIRTDDLLITNELLYRLS